MMRNLLSTVSVKCNYESGKVFIVQNVLIHNKMYNIHYCTVQESAVTFRLMR